MKPFTLMFLLILAVLVGPAGTALAQDTDPRDVKARELFTVAKYQEALDLYGKLYAETLHPAYLRNVARCYQMMGDADHAIVSFRDYLRRTKDLAPEKRDEINGFIHEMEELKQRKAAEATEAAKPAPTQVVKAPVVVPVAPVVPATVTPVVAQAPAGVDLSDEAKPKADRDDSNVWLWGTLGVAVVGAVVAGIILLGGQEDKRPAAQLGWHDGGV